MDVLRSRAGLVGGFALALGGRRLFAGLPRGPVGLGLPLLGAGFHHLEEGTGMDTGLIIAMVLAAIALVALFLVLMGYAAPSPHMRAAGYAGRTMDPRVELLYWEGCPSWPKALEQLRAEMGEAGLDPGTIDVIEVDDEEQAHALRFSGSPTIRVDGRDAAPAPGEPAALTCRVYRTRDGRVSPVPDPADVRDALRAALGDRAA